MERDSILNPAILYTVCTTFACVIINIISGKKNENIITIYLKRKKEHISTSIS